MEKVGKALNCKICERRCLISEGKTCFCEMRENNEVKFITSIMLLHHLCLWIL